MATGSLRAALTGTASTITCRWEITLMIVVQAVALYLFGRLVTDRPALTPALLGVAVFAVAAQGLCSVLNDISDLDGDRLNHPERPLPAGRVSVRQAWTVVAVCLVVCVVVGVPLAGTALAAGALAMHLVTSILYSLPRVRLGRHWLAGPLTLVTSTVAGIVFVLACSGLPTDVDGGGAVVLLIAAACFLNHLLVIPLKDIRDVAGDARVGGSSLALRLPIGAVKAIGATGYLLPWVALYAGTRWIGAAPGVPQGTLDGLALSAAVFLCLGLVMTWTIFFRGHLLTESQRFCWFAELGVLFLFQATLPVFVLIA